MSVATKITRSGTQILGSSEFVSDPLRREQRSALRLALDPGEASLTTAQAIDITLVDLSASGVGLVLPRGFAPIASELDAVLRLDERRIAVRLDPVHLTIGGDASRLGARFRDLTDETLREIGDFLIEGFLRKERRLSRLDRAGSPTLRFHDATFVAALLRHKALHQTSPLLVFRGDTLLSTRLLVLEIAESEGRCRLLATACDEHAGTLGEGVYTLLVPSGIATTCFSSRISRRADGAYLIEAPQEIRLVGFRGSSRQRLSDDEAVVLSAPHPRAVGLWIRARVREVSARGFSFSWSHAGALLLPGDMLRPLTLMLPAGVITASAVVRRVLPDPDMREMECGLEIASFQNNGDRERWERFALKKTHPRVHVNEPGLEDAAWRLLSTSGYLKLWTLPIDLERLEAAFRSSWRGVSRSVGHLLVRREDSRNIGMFATSRLYPRTWLLHSLCIDKTEMRRRRSFLDASRDLYSALIHILTCMPEARYFVGYFEKDQRWGDLLYGDFLAAYSDPHASLYDEYRLYKWRADGTERAFGVAAAPRLTVRFATARELTMLSRLLTKTVSPLEYNAFSYGADEIDLDRFRAACAEHGYERGRWVYCARDGGTPAAFLIAESGGEGVSVFGLVNRCWIVWRSARSRRAEVKRRLLATAADHYRRLAKSEAIFLDTDDLDTPADSGFCFVADGVRWLARLDLVPAWRCYIDEALGLRAR
jgi:hypothetical protein